MEAGREVRFTNEVIREAADRVNEAKAEELERHATQTGACGALIDRLGWDGETMNLTLEGYVPTLLETTEYLDEDERLGMLIRTAMVDGLMLGALCADITYERAWGLVTA